MGVTPCSGREMTHPSRFFHRLPQAYWKSMNPHQTNSVLTEIGDCLCSLPLCYISPQILHYPHSQSATFFCRQFSLPSQHHQTSFPYTRIASLVGGSSYVLRGPHVKGKLCEYTPMPGLRKFHSSTSISFFLLILFPQLICLFPSCYNHIKRTNFASSTWFESQAFNISDTSCGVFLTFGLLEFSLFYS